MRHDARAAPQWITRLTHPDMMVESHRNMLWPDYLSMMLGLWLLTSPFTLGYMSNFSFRRQPVARH